MRLLSWKLVVGLVLLVGVARGGAVGRPEWVGTALDVLLFVVGAWLVFDAGRAVGDSTTEAGLADRRGARLTILQPGYPGDRSRRFASTTAATSTDRERPQQPAAAEPARRLAHRALHWSS